MKIKINNIVFDTVKVNDIILKGNKWISGISITDNLPYSDIPNFILEQIENDIKEGESEGGTIYTRTSDENPELREYNWEITL